MNIRVFTSDEVDKLRRINGCHAIVRIEFYVSHIEKSLANNAIFPAREGEIITLIHFKCFDPLDGFSNFF